MLKHDEYIKFKEKARKHLPDTLNSFEFWGERVGRIDGDIKDKWGEARWYANLERPRNLYDILYRPRAYHKYEWSPEKGFKFRVLDIVNNVSSIMIPLMFMFFLYRLLFYNVAYWVAFAKNPDCAKYILSSSDYPRKVILGKQFVKLMSWLENKRRKNE